MSYRCLLVAILGLNGACSSPDRSEPAPADLRFLEPNGIADKAFSRFGLAWEVGAPTLRSLVSLYVSVRPGERDELIATGLDSSQRSLWWSVEGRAPGRYFITAVLQSEGTEREVASVFPVIVTSEDRALETVLTEQSAIAVTTYQSMVLDAAGNPLLAFTQGWDDAQRMTHGLLALASPSSTGFVASIVDTSVDNTGRMPSSANAPDGRSCVSYHNSSYGVLQFGCGDRQTFSAEMADGGAGGPLTGAYPSLAFDSAGNPAIAYADYEAPNLIIEVRRVKLTRKLESQSERINLPRAGS